MPRKRNTLRPAIERVKAYIRDSKLPFDGEGYIFSIALREVRKEGYVIMRNRKQCHYVNQGKLYGKSGSENPA